MADRFQELAIDSLRIPLDDIKLATNNFANDNFIGQGGFGRVYKGQLKTSSGEPGTLVAVKRLDMKITGQGRREFLKEIMMLANYKHNNLVSLVGFCDEEEVKALVYKHEVRGSLDKHIASTDLKWETRLKICLGAARGLEYLHHDVGTGHRVLHRDIKSSNILLDENWEAKISDFGLSTIGPKDQQFTLLVTEACGTLGYIDPQYIETGIITKESDVYSFGVVMFEVLCGRLAMLAQSNDDDDVRKSLSRLVKVRYDEGNLEEIIIPDLLRRSNLQSLDKFSEVAYECLSKDRKQRPTMSYVVQELEAALDFQIGNIVRTEVWGSTGGHPWEFMFNNNQKLREIIIGHDAFIYTVTFVVEDINGSLVTSRQYGGDGELASDYKHSKIILDVDEEVTGISGTVGICRFYIPPILVISSLYFKTNKNNYGVYGDPENVYSEFSRSWDVGSLVGFRGRSGKCLDAFSCWLKN